MYLYFVRPSFCMCVLLQRLALNLFSQIYVNFLLQKPLLSFFLIKYLHFNLFEKASLYKYIPVRRPNKNIAFHMKLHLLLYRVNYLKNTHKMAMLTKYNHGKNVVYCADAVLYVDEFVRQLWRKISNFKR